MTTSLSRQVSADWGCQEINFKWDITSNQNDCLLKILDVLLQPVFQLPENVLKILCDTSCIMVIYIF